MYTKLNREDIGYFKQINPMTQDDVLNKAVVYNEEKHGRQLHAFFPISKHSNDVYKFNKIDVDLASELRFACVENEHGERYLIHANESIEEKGDREHLSIKLMVNVYDQLINSNVVNENLKETLEYLGGVDIVKNFQLNKDCEQITDKLKNIFYSEV